MLIVCMYDLTDDLYTKRAKGLYEKRYVFSQFQQLSDHVVSKSSILWFCLGRNVSSCLNLKFGEPISCMYVFSPGDVIPTLLFYYFRIDCWHYEGSVWLG